MSKLLADKKKLFDIDKDNLMFHNKALFALLIPIVVEQLLNSFMGMAGRVSGGDTDSVQKAVSGSKTLTSKEYNKSRSERLKFTYKEQKEYETIDDDIAALEKDIERIDAEMSKCATDYGKLNDLSKEKAEKEKQLDEKMDRWVYLNDLAERIANQ